MKLNSIKKSYQLQHTFKAEWTAYIIFFVLFIPLIILNIFTYLKYNLIYPWGILIFLIFFSIIIYLFSLKITIQGNKIIYRTLFSEKRVSINKIKKVKMRIGFKKGLKDINSGFYILDLVRNNKKLSINIKPFSKQNLTILINSIIDQNHNIELDEFTLALKNNNLKPIVKEGVKTMLQTISIVLIIEVVIIIAKSLYKLLTI